MTSCQNVKSPFPFGALLWNRCQKKLRHCTDLLDKRNSSLFGHLDFVDFRPDCRNNRFPILCSMNSTQSGLLATGIQRTKVQAFTGYVLRFMVANRVFEPVRDSHRRQCGTPGILDPCGRYAQIEREHCWSYRSYFGVSARGMSKLALAPSTQGLLTLQSLLGRRSRHCYGINCNNDPVQRSAA
jgi:hypothetical protein